MPALSNRLAATLLATAALGGLTNAASAQAVVYDTTAAGSTVPFATAGGSLRYQQVYDGAAFGGPALLDGLAFNGFGGAGFNALIDDVEITLSTTAATPTAFSTTFANNLGADATVVHSGSLVLSSLGDAYDVQIAFDQAFAFDPAAGNLLLSLRVVGSDAAVLLQAGSSSALARVLTTPPGDADSSSGTGNAGFGLATAWSVSPVPEPGSAALMLAGLALAAPLLRRRLR